MRKALTSLLLFFPLLLQAQTNPLKSVEMQKVDQVLDSYIKKNFNGAVLIAKNGKVEYLKYIGIANRHYDIKFSEKTRFKIFSVTKTFTAVLIMQLYEQGKINLDSTISTYYPAYKGEAAKKATIRNLLTYSSGRDTKEMRDVFEAYSNNIWSVDEFIQKFCSERLIYAPGTKFNYSNGDYIILGKIIENIYKKPFEEVLREKILTPLHMQHTDYLHHNDIISNIDEGYANDGPDATKIHMPTNHYIDNHFSAGAMYSTPEDLLIFDQAIFNHTILKKETIDLMLTPYESLESVAIGFWVYPKKFGKINTLLAERQGAGYGHNSNWIHLIDKGLTFILLSNTNTVELNKMRFDVISAYLGQ
ncbi:beta-lactamase family protein [Pedobacter sp. PAMC26386]|nr:beta-lactamase family protein [Pedobacter sp. PAMC26386]